MSLTAEHLDTLFAIAKMETQAVNQLGETSTPPNRARSFSYASLLFERF